MQRVLSRALNALVLFAVTGRGAPASVRGSSSAEYLVAEGQPEDWGGLCGRVAANLESPSPSRWLGWRLALNTINGIVSSDQIVGADWLESGSSTKGGADGRHRPPGGRAAVSRGPTAVNETLPQVLRAQKY